MGRSRVATGPECQAGTPCADDAIRTRRLTAWRAVGLPLAYVGLGVERVRRIELLLFAWEANGLPLADTRKILRVLLFGPSSKEYRSCHCCLGVLSTSTCEDLNPEPSPCKGAALRIAPQVVKPRTGFVARVLEGSRTPTSEDTASSTLRV